jgi:hypothetical protein
VAPLLAVPVQEILKGPAELSSRRQRHQSRKGVAGPGCSTNPAIVQSVVTSEALLCSSRKHSVMSPGADPGGLGTAAEVADPRVTREIAAGTKDG